MPDPKARTPLRSHEKGDGVGHHCGAWHPSAEQSGPGEWTEFSATGLAASTGKPAGAQGIWRRASAAIECSPENKQSSVSRHDMPRLRESRRSAGSRELVREVAGRLLEEADRSRGHRTDRGRVGRKTPAPAPTGATGTGTRRWPRRPAMRHPHPSPALASAGHVSTTRPSRRWPQRLASTACPPARSMTCSKPSDRRPVQRRAGFPGSVSVFAGQLEVFRSRLLDRLQSPHASLDALPPEHRRHEPSGHRRAALVRRTLGQCPDAAPGPNRFAFTVSITRRKDQPSSSTPTRPGPSAAAPRDGDLVEPPRRAVGPRVAHQVVPRISGQVFHRAAGVHPGAPRGSSCCLPTAKQLTGPNQASYVRG